MAGLTVSSTLSPLVQAYYDKKFLLRAKQELAFYQFAQKRELPQGSGKTVYFSRYTPLTKQTSALSETSDGGLSLSTRQQLNSEEVSATVALWGDYIALSRIASLTAIDPDVSEKSDLLGQQAGESIDYYIGKIASTGLKHRRADGSATYQQEATVTTNGTSSQLITTELTGSGSVFTGGYVTVISGTNYGETRKVTNHTEASGTHTLTVSPAFSKASDTTTRFRVVVGTGLTSSNVLTTANLRLAIRDLKRSRAMKMDNGYYILLINPDVEYDFMGDTTWVSAATYKNNVDYLYTGEIGKWLGCRVVNATQLYRETTAGVESETGAVHNVVLLGKEAYGVVELEGQKQKIYVKNPEQLAQPIPMYSTVGWQIGFEAVALNGNFGVVIMCGASN